MTAPKRVALFVDMQAAYGREILQGISRYVRSRAEWVVYGDPDRVVAPIENLSRWVGHGVIAQAWRADIRETLQSLRLPVVNVSQHLPESEFPSVVSDSAAIGRMVAQHLLERGFRHFAYCGYLGHHYSEQRAVSFCQAVTEAGGTCTRLDTEPPQIRPELWEQGQVDLGNWLRGLPRPVGVMACNDARARQIARVCSDIGLRIPEELALVGVDNDTLVCDMSNPPLSSVDASAERIGYEAAAMLDEMMSGRAGPVSTPVRVPPRGVVVRRSSEILAITDPLLATAIRFIHDNASLPVEVDDVVAAVPLSRRVLERRFRATFNCTIWESISGARIEQMKRALINDDAPIPVLAERAGFRYVQQFNRLFKQFTGLTPTRYRRQFRTF